MPDDQNEDAHGDLKDICSVLYRPYQPGISLLPLLSFSFPFKQGNSNEITLSHFMKHSLHLKTVIGADI